mgnify:CR=1 FL=1
MARLIVKSPYIKCGTGQSAGGYLKYIATRERVEIIPDDRPPTQNQEQLIVKLVKDFPDAKELMEYEDYLSHPTKATASALITLTLEENWDRVQGMEGYAKYIALRPRAERLGEHGLFGDDDAVDLAAVADELDHYTGNVWTHIISLHREDAERLGYDHADAWRTLLRTHRNDIASAMKIPPEDFRWYAAFHDEGNHPHVHMMAWSAKPNQNNHKIIRAFFTAEESFGSVTLDTMEKLCGDKSKSDLYVSNFKNNYAQMKLDGPKTYGKVFEDDGENVWIWKEVEQMLRKYKDSFLE